MSSIYGDMPVTDNLNVIRLWKEGKNARNHRQTLFAIDGELLSYHRKIGHRTKAGVCVVADLDLDDVPLTYADNIKATLAHIALAKGFADTVFHQLVSECSPLFRDEVPF
ncbi:MAG: hypothetical protein VX978_05850 [Pseudomonadota bacterium]|nr:hypothetical protein [Pseudomonadota bacterium]